MKKLILALSLFSSSVLALPTEKAVVANIPADGLYVCNVGVFRMVGDEISLEDIFDKKGLVNFKKNVVTLDYSWINKTSTLVPKKYSDADEYYLHGNPDNNSSIFIGYDEERKSYTFNITIYNHHKEYYFHDCKKTK